MSIRWLTVGLLMAIVVGACSDEAAGIEGFATSTVLVDGRELTVAVADTGELRAQGLMGIADLGELDGMVFVFAEDTGTGFWMKNTLIALDIAFFDEDGGFVDVLAMEPCSEDPCPVYRPSGSYRYAIEAPAGDLAFIGPGSTLFLPG